MSMSAVLNIICRNHRFFVARRHGRCSRSRFVWKKSSTFYKIDKKVAFRARPPFMPGKQSFVQKQSQYTHFRFVHQLSIQIRLNPACIHIWSSLWLWRTTPNRDKIGKNSFSSWSFEPAPGLKRAPCPEGSTRPIVQITDERVRHSNVGWPIRHPNLKPIQVNLGPIDVRIASHKAIDNCLALVYLNKAKRLLSTEKKRLLVYVKTANRRQPIANETRYDHKLNFESFLVTWVPFWCTLPTPNVFDGLNFHPGVEQGASHQSDRDQSALCWPCNLIKSTGDLPNTSA